jgi:hypothetical protein
MDARSPRAPKRADQRGAAFCGKFCGTNTTYGVATCCPGAADCRAEWPETNHRDPSLTLSSVTIRRWRAWFCKENPTALCGRHGVEIAVRCAENSYSKKR